MCYISVHIQTHMRMHTCTYLDIYVSLVSVSFKGLHIHVNVHIAGKTELHIHTVILLG